MRYVKNKLLSFSLLALAAYSSQSFAESHGPFGVGVIVGEPTGLTVKYFRSQTVAIDGGFAYSFNHYALFYGDYLFHFPNAIRQAPIRLIPYVGVGAVMAFAGSDSPYRKTGDGAIGLGLRIPVGMEWEVSGAPLGVFVEIVPGMGIIPETFMLLQGGIGVRFFF